MILLQNHKPKVFGDLILASPELQQRLRKYASGRRSNSLLLYGPFGTGKSTIARVVQQELHSAAGSPNEPWAFVGTELASDFEEEIENCWNWGATDGVKHPRVIIDELDQAPTTRQLELRALMDKRPDFGFIFTTNCLQDIDGGIKDRCDVLEIPMSPPKAWINLVRTALAAEGVNITDNQALRLVQAAPNSIRDISRSIEELIP